MALKIKFDMNHDPIAPTMILANKNGNKLGYISNAYSFKVTDAMTETPTLFFKVTKTNNAEILPIWEQIENLKLVWCVEWDYWFEIKVEIDDAEETIKNIDCTALSQAELSQINLYETQINTEDDIARESYDIPTTIYNPKRPDASLLHRMLEKAPHYTIKHVDDTIAKLQRIFEFDKNSLKDCFNEIEDEIHCLVCYGNNSISDDELGQIPERSISLYDLESNCVSCGYRGEFSGACPQCGSNLIIDGYGQDTTIFICKENLTDDITFTTDVDSIKNCFRLVAGDDLMTATIRNCNPNGSNYIWYISEQMKADMPKELAALLENYNNTYQYYLNEYNLAVGKDLVDQYNLLIKKYKVYNQDLQDILYPMVGYTSLSHTLYNVIDFQLYLEHSLMPIPSMSETDAGKEAKLLTSGNLSPCAVTNLSSISQTTVELNVLAIAKVIVRPTYKVDINESSFDKGINKWTGNFKVTNYSDEEDTATSNTVTVVINDDYEQYVRQKLDKALKDESTEVYDVSSLFKSDNFANELKKYGLESLETFYSCCQGCLDVLSEQGVGTPGTWDELQFGTNLYEEFYTDYLNKLNAIESEISVRESEDSIIQKLYDTLLEERKKIQQFLNLEEYLGEKMWKLFCAYRREDEYENSNYISDGLTNAELFKLANEFIESAQKEIYKSATMQHHISASLKDLLVIKEFEKLLDSFEVGNWMRIECDGVIYKLRLISYEIDFDNLEYIDVEFSDVIDTVDGRSDINSILSKADSIASSYDSYKKQASKGESVSEELTYWHKYGLDTTLTRIIKGADDQDIVWDEHGLLFRQKDYITNGFFPEQMKIINKTIAITDDAWKTLKTAIGNFYYVNPKTGKLENGYGINGEVIIGKLILGEELGIYNESGSLTFDLDGFKITNKKNTFTVNPNSEKLLTLSNQSGDIMWVDEDGMLHLKGDGAGLDISSNDSVTGLSASLKVNADAIQTEITRATKSEETLSGQITATETSLSSKIEQTAESITSTVTEKINEETRRAQKAENDLGTEITTTETSLSSQIEQTAESITSTVTKQINEEVKRATDAENGLGDTIESVSTTLSTEIKQTATDITSKVTAETKRATEKEDELGGKITSVETSVSEINQKAGSIELSVTTERKRAEEAEGKLSTGIDEEKKRATGAEGDLSTSIDTEKDRAIEVESELRSSITITADSIISSVSKSISKYDITGYNVSSYGFADPTPTAPPANTNNGKYYLNQSTGNLYVSNGSTWNKVKTLNLITDSLSSRIDQKADSIELTVVSNNVTTEKTRAEGVEEELRAGLKVTNESITSEIDRAKGVEEDIDGKITSNVTALSSKIEQTADSITTTVSMAMNKYDTGEYSISFYGFGVPDNNKNPASANSGKYYLDQSTGNLYISNGSTWRKTTTLSSNVEYLKSEIKNLPGKITLTVDGSLGGKASITLDAAGTKTSGTVDLGNVRKKFASDETNITISSGTITFLSNTLIVDSNNFKLTADGNVEVTGNITSTTLYAKQCIYLYTNDKYSNRTCISTKDARVVLGAEVVGSEVIQIGNGLESYGPLYNYGEIYENGMTLSSKYAASSHTHSGYALSNHTHDQYLDMSSNAVQNVWSPVSFYGAVSFDSATFSGSIVANGNIISFTSSQIECGIDGGLYFYGASNNKSRGMFLAIGNSVWTLAPSTDEGLRLGTSSNRWNQIFSSKGTINTSDANQKNSIAPISESYESIFSKLHPVTYKFNNGDRIHTGFISQEVLGAIEESGLTANDWGAFCRDLKEESNDEYVYGLRYNEIIPLNTHMIQKLIKEVCELKNEIAELRKYKSN